MLGFALAACRTGLMVSQAMDWLLAVDTGWGHVKLLIEQSFGGYNDVLHVIAGPVLLLLAAALLRQSISRIWPWLAVLLLELLNEWHDLAAEIWPNRQMQLGEGLKDILLTMCLPTILMFVARNFPHLLGMNPVRKKRRER